MCPKLCEVVLSRAGETWPEDLLYLERTELKKVYLYSGEILHYALELPLNEEEKYVRYEVITAVTMKNCVFWDVAPCGSCKNRRCGGT
jgi:hypothetical protein